MHIHIHGLIYEESAPESWAWTGNYVPQYFMRCNNLSMRCSHVLVIKSAYVILLVIQIFCLFLTKYQQSQGLLYTVDKVVNYLCARSMHETLPRCWLHSQKDSWLSVCKGCVLHCVRGQCLICGSYPLRFQVCRYLGIEVLSFQHTVAQTKSP